MIIPSLVPILSFSRPELVPRYASTQVSFSSQTLNRPHDFVLKTETIYKDQESTLESIQKCPKYVPSTKGKL